MKNILILLVIVVAIVILVTNLSSVHSDNAQPENVTSSATTTNLYSVPSGNAQSETVMSRAMTTESVPPKVSPATTKSVWGNCVPITSSKTSFDIEQQKSLYGGNVMNTAFQLRFYDNAQVRLRNGILVSLCGADVDPAIALISSMGGKAGYADSVAEATKDEWAKKSGKNLNSEYIVTLPNTGIESVEDKISSLYSLKLVESITLIPVSSTP